MGAGELFSKFFPAPRLEIWSESELENGEDQLWHGILCERARARTNVGVPQKRTLLHAQVDNTRGLMKQIM